MSEDNLKEILAKYQQKAFELFNTNIVLETQVSSLQKQVNDLITENEKLKKVRKGSKPEEDFS